MAKYIDSDAFLEQERAWYCNNCIRRTDSNGKIVYKIGEAPCQACHINDLLDEVENCPAADVAERKAGKWCADYDYAEYDFDGSTPLPEPRKFQDGWKCSLCGGYSPSETNYCPNCGAQMIGGDDDV